LQLTLEKNINKRVPLVLTYHPSLEKISGIVHHHWKEIQKSETLTKLFYGTLVRLQRLSPHGLHWPTVDEEGLDTAALTSVSLMLLGRRNATTGGSGNNLVSVSLFSILLQ
jgi:hypothetical protein